MGQAFNVKKEYQEGGSKFAMKQTFKTFVILFPVSAAEVVIHCLYHLNICARCLKLIQTMLHETSSIANENFPGSLNPNSK